MQMGIAECAVALLQAQAGHAAE